MYIGIDAHQIGTDLGGNASYITGLVKALGEIDRENRYVIYVSKLEPAASLISGLDNFKVQLVRPHDPLIRIPFSMNIALRRDPVDVLLVQYTAPPFAPCKVVAVVHDISYEHIPETFRVIERARMKLTIRRTARKADHVVVPSEYTRQDLICTYNLQPERVTIVPLAADENFRPVTDADELARVKKRYDLPDSYLLGLGSVQPRKNLVRLIEAYSILSDKRDLPPLILVGKKAWLFEDSLKAAKEHGVEDKVRFTDFVPDEDLPGLYTLSTCFVYPSFFEGFGIPPLEAMQCGSPVIAGDRTSLPEVVGNAGILIDPFDVTSIADAIDRMLSDSELRDDLRQKGFERAKVFSWKRAARETLDIFERVMND
jgi:glycosyltransferase involved in cell wall biosynthesis